MASTSRARKRAGLPRPADGLGVRRGRPRSARVGVGHSGAGRQPEAQAQSRHPGSDAQPTAKPIATTGRLSGVGRAADRVCIRQPKAAAPALCEHYRHHPPEPDSSVRIPACQKVTLTPRSTAGRLISRSTSWGFQASRGKCHSRYSTSINRSKNSSCERNCPPGKCLRTVFSNEACTICVVRQRHRRSADDEDQRASADSLQLGAEVAGNRIRLRTGCRTSARPSRPRPTTASTRSRAKPPRLSPGCWPRTPVSRRVRFSCLRGCRRESRVSGWTARGNNGSNVMFATA